MTLPTRVALVAAVASMLVACTGGGAAPTPTASDLPTPTASDSPGPTASGPPSGTPASGVPSVAALVHMLATPADLGPEWRLWEGFAAWPGGAPGVIPDDQRALTPKVPMCPSAGEEAVALAEGLRWQVFTQLHQTTPDPFATMVVAQQLLLADDPARTAATFATLRDGLTACLTENLPDGDWEIGLREPLEVPAVGDDRFAERSSSFDPGEARRDTRLVLVEDGPVLMVIQIDEVLIRPDAEASLTQETVDAVVSSMADRLR